MKNLIWMAAALVTFTAVLAGCGATANSTPSNPSGVGTSVATTASASTSPTNATAASGNTTGAVSGNSATSTNSATNQSNLKMQYVSMTVLPGGRLGPDGKMHDTFTNPSPTVQVGIPVTLTVYNYDGGAHTVTNSDLGLNLEAGPSPKNGVPGVTTVTFTPTKTGDFQWQCMDPCDSEAGGWAMSHVGYMEGIIHVVPATHKQYLYIAIKDGLQYASADGKLHDSYSPADLTVQAGIPVQVTVENFDTGSHSMTSASLGLNQDFPGASKEGVPSKTVFTFTPAKAGSFKWQCIIQCDGNGFAMTHGGYMAGTITAVS